MSAALFAYLNRLHSRAKEFQHPQATNTPGLDHVQGQHPQRLPPQSSGASSVHAAALQEDDDDVDFDDSDMDYEHTWVLENKIEANDADMLQQMQRSIDECPAGAFFGMPASK